jgi:hypothetical protein
MQSLIERFTDLLGEGKVSASPLGLNAYKQGLRHDGGGRPLLAVFPETRAEVQAIVRLANEKGMPLVPVSSGPPRFHGGTACKTDSVIVDFSRMNRILRIDPDNRSVMLEPGATFGAVIPMLKAQGLRISTPLLPRANKSVVACHLEREPGTIPKYHYDHLDPLLTLEVVYGTGDDFRTGSASGPGSLETLKADKVNPWGPGSLDYYRFVSAAQGSMGLVTWAVLKTEVLPVIKRPYFIPVTDPGRLTAPMNELLRRRIVDECLALNRHTLAAILAGDDAREFARLQAALPPWTILLAISGYQRRPEERVRVQEKHLFDVGDRLGIAIEPDLPGLRGRGAELLESLENPWPETPHWKLRSGDSHDIFFLCPMSKVASLILLMQELARDAGVNGEIGGYIQPVTQGRGCHCEFHFSGADPAMARLSAEAPEALMNHGAFFSRPYGAWADLVYRDYAEGVAALRELKRIFDPNNILNPGKLCFE